MGCLSRFAHVMNVRPQTKPHHLKAGTSAHSTTSPRSLEVVRPVGQRKGESSCGTTRCGKSGRPESPTFDGGVRSLGQ